ENYFKPSGVSKFCTTAKKENLAVYKAARSLYNDWYDTSFVYLTISTDARFSNINSTGRDPGFSAGLLSGRHSLRSWHKISDSGIGVFYTYKMYSLLVNHISPLVRLGIKLRNLFKGSRMSVPSRGEEIKFVTAFDITRENINSFPGILKDLRDKGIQFCNIVCSQNDFIHEALRNFALNEYEYILIRSFELDDNDRITIDVRCL
ncbi:MAG: hypothetical protein HKN67_11160, partial [Saprospiraceae bacterium]|nr:hypothetical protein [Saprospiraceae bacterium]